MRHIILVLMVAAILVATGSAAKVQPYQINTDQPWNSQLHGVLNGSAQDDAVAKAQMDQNDSLLAATIAAMKASLTTGEDLTMTSDTPWLIHAGNAYSNQTIILPEASGNLSTIYTISFDTFSAYRVFVNASPGTITENLSIVCGDAYQFLSNGTMWAISPWQVALS